MRAVVAALLLACCIAIVTAGGAQARRYHHGASDGRPSAWCGWWMMHRHGLNDRRLWRAIEWARMGHAASGPAARVIGVMRHHVFEVIKVVGPGKVLAISGNDGRAVRTRVRSTAGVIAWRSL